jgi:hypothetical protein
LKRFLRNNSLSIFFFAIFLVALAGQSVAGFNQYNENEVSHAKMAHEKPETISYGEYLVSPEFSRDVMENWQSEYLQFLLYILATVWLVQRGSPESKRPKDAGLEDHERQKVGEDAAENSPLLASVGGIVTRLYSNSLLILMGAIFALSWFAQSITGWPAFNEEQAQHGQAAVSWFSYLGTSDFWERTLQNWQSEFLAVGSMAVFAVYLRQRGSPESKPVGAPHDATGIEG